MEDNQTLQPEQIDQIQPPQSPLHRWLPTIIGIIVVIFAVGGVFAWQFFQSPEDKGVVVPQTTDETANWQTYRNEEFGFEVKYPNSTKRNENRIYLSFASGTTLSEKYLEISTKKMSLDNCSNPTNTIIGKTESIHINGIEFKKETGGDAGAGQIYNVTSYSTAKGDQCVGLSFVLHSANPGAFGDSPPPTFDREKESIVFQQILSTFKFTD